MPVPIQSDSIPWSEVYERLCEHHEKNPSTHLAIYMNYPGTEQGYTRESMELFASEIAPKLRKL
ncbi:MAG: hypothetical protein HY749_10170 [Gammaproteobacteria bacterium]|nr:hypothetical protein [Gammaproteobacteria bacterium]MBI5615693.1 hypothetical protein [Gammaproteobacteria bacterium]